MLRRLVVPVLAIALAATAAIYARALIEGQKKEIIATAAVAPAEPVRTLSVLVADQDLPTGAFVKPDMLRWQEWPEVDLPQTYLVRNSTTIEEFEGGVVRENILRGQPILSNNIVLPGDRGFLAAVLNPGTRAISVPVDEASSHAGLIFPGDYVDLILTQTVQQENAESAVQRRASETVLGNVRVIAMGRALSVEPDDVENGSTLQIRTATLEVQPDDAELVALVSEMGKLSLSLRSLAQDEEQPTADFNQRRIATWDSDVSAAFDFTEQPRTSLKIIRPSGIEEFEDSQEGPIE